MESAGGGCSPFMGISYIQLIGGAVEFNCVVADFLPAGCVHFQWRGVAVSNNSPVSLGSQLLPHVYSYCVVRCIHITDHYVSLECSPPWYSVISLIDFLALMFALSETKITTLTFCDLCCHGVFTPPPLFSIPVLLSVCVFIFKAAFFLHNMQLGLTF